MTFENNNIETEYLELNSKNEWPVIYKKIREQSLNNNSACTEAIKPQNKILNRYRDVSPYDHSRIILQRGSTDYINANLVEVVKANRKYILTQGPLSNTVSHFWLMVWEQHSKAILMLNKLIENKQEKCYQYWPTKIGPNHAMKLSDVNLKVEYLEQSDYSYFLTRSIRLTDLDSNTSRDIIQFHYTTWPDFGVPSSPTAFLEFLRKVRAEGVLESDVGPAVVHCSAGIGRSGTFCLVDSCLILIEKFGLNSIDLKEILLDMRKYRMGLIQTAEQLRFSYQAIIEGAKQLINPDSVTEISAKTHLTENDCQESSSEDDDAPPPLPPPRMESLKRTNGSPTDRPLPKIPNSVSLNDVNYDKDEKEVSEEADVPSDDELIDEDKSDSIDSDHSETPSNTNESISPSELRHRKRLEKKEQMEAKVREMKRRQQVSEQWTQLKRSLYKPLFIAGSLVLGGGVFAYFYFAYKKS